jgi:hypothetical protein
MQFHLPKPLHGWRAFVGEVGIIVLGVLIALTAGQVVEWVHWRQQQRETLERLFQESRANVALLRRGHEVLDRETGQEEQFAAALTQGVCPPAEQWRAARDIIKYPQVAAETSVYDEVIGAGGLASIASTKAREAISDFHSKLAWLQSTTEFFRSKAERPFDLGDPRVTITYAPKADDPEFMTFDREALCRDKGFRNRVAVGVRNRVTWSDFHGPVVQSAIDLCRELGRELGQRCTPSEGAERRIAAAARER